MNRSLVLTIIGPDRTGLVESIASRISSHGGNWLGSRMARLAGKFAGILHVHVPADRHDALVASLRELRDAGLCVHIEHVDADTSHGLRPVQLHLVGLDHPGIVHDLARALADVGVNIDELETETTNAPMSGETLFNANAILGVPLAISTDALRARLDAVANQMVVDITVTDEPR